MGQLIQPGEAESPFEPIFNGLIAILTGHMKASGAFLYYGLAFGAMLGFLLDVCACGVPIQVTKLLPAIILCTSHIRVPRNLMCKAHLESAFITLDHCTQRIDVFEDLAVFAAR